MELHIVQKFTLIHVYLGGRLPSSLRGVPALVLAERLSRPPWDPGWPARSGGSAPRPGRMRPVFPLHAGHRYFISGVINGGHRLLPTMFQKDLRYLEIIDHRSCSACYTWRPPFVSGNFKIVVSGYWKIGGQRCLSIFGISFEYFSL